jgi:hypothetical protein
MQFKKGAQLYSYEVQRESGEDILYINYLGAPFVPSLADSSEVMGRVIDALIENPNISRIVLVQQKNYNYDFKETAMLLEIARIYIFLINQEKILSQKKLVLNCPRFFSKRYNDLFSFLYLLKQDPIGAYIQLKRLIIEGKIMADSIGIESRADQANYINLLEKIFEMVEKSKLINEAAPFFKSYSKGDREIYNKILKADIIPNFTFTRLVFDFPDDAEMIDQYKIAQESYDESLVTIFKIKNEAKMLYHLTPPENSLSEEHNMLLNLARGVLIEHQPRAEEFTDTERTRQVFFNISKDLLQDLAQTKGIKLNYNGINQLATILVRHTI